MPAEDMRKILASSPVVPAPTETGPWQTWQEVPEGVKYRTTRFPDGSQYVNRNGVRFLVGGMESRAKDELIRSFAPFVAAEEG